MERNRFLLHPIVLSNRITNISAESEKLLSLYKKFGFQYMAHLTDIAIGTAMEVIPASENKSKIMR